MLFGERTHRFESPSELAHLNMAGLQREGFKHVPKFAPQVRLIFLKNIPFLREAESIRVCQRRKVLHLHFRLAHEGAVLVDRDS